MRVLWLLPFIAVALLWYFFYLLLTKAEFFKTGIAGASAWLVAFLFTGIAWRRCINPAKKKTIAKAIWTEVIILVSVLASIFLGYLRIGTH